MKIIIMEGIATSGKTTVRDKLKEALTKQGARFSIVSEDETLIPLLYNKDKKMAIDLLKEVITEALRGDKDYIIFERLFFTHIFKTSSSIEDFKEIEDLVRDQSLLALLKIDEPQIIERINTARKHREQKWIDHIDKKGSDENILNYYIGQQKLLLDLAERTSLRHKIYDTTSMDFEDIARNILQTLSEG